MSVTIRTCLVVTCTRCGQVDDDYPTLHASTVDELRDWLSDWQWANPDTPDFCPRCVTELDCERNGHRWGDWQPGVTRPELRFRSCGHCGDAVMHNPAHTLTPPHP
ncbi:hypothetical protein [Nonomuraea aurantiaca]|uniref:hypothetical protein n=1 Tax=Nonomuraea aurantiaca TaxID=2878562 RepID=UPI001CD9913D|nr:hypothetical protein [Nonomuraea aurantiaca]MCA2227398.1 hypothetical protein [Nonomuraea aurantiaca]